MKELLISNIPYILATAAFILITTWKKLQSRRDIIEKAVDAAFYIVENMKHTTESKVDDKAAEGLAQLKALLANKKMKVTKKVSEQATSRFEELHGRQKAEG